MTTKEMTKGEREELKKLARERARVAKADVDRRSADLRAVFEQQVAQEYEWDRDEVWEKAVIEANNAVKAASEVIADRCVELGIPRELAPHVRFEWIGRGQHAVAQRQSELRRAAYQRIDAMARTAKQEIDRSSLEIQTQLVRAGITSDAGIQFLEGMPVVEDLMPAIDMTQITDGLG